MRYHHANFVCVCGEVGGGASLCISPLFKF